jgi:glyoxylase-like metal-dependent hydrolase (beta-lactamase superfamily II)
LVPNCHHREVAEMIHRRELLALSGASLAGAVLGVDRVAARSAPTTSQVPGFYRFNLGKHQITVVSDGTITFPTEALWPSRPKEARTAVLAADHQAPDELALQMNALAVNTGDKLVLIDAGTRGKVWPSSGRLLANLKAAGIEPADVDTVLITHAHPDHMWGVLDPSDAELTFPNAE